MYKRQSIANVGISIAEFFANVFKHPIKAVAHLFLGFINFLIDKVKYVSYTHLMECKEK